MATSGCESGFLALDGNGRLRAGNGGRRLECHTEEEGLAIADSALHATRAVTCRMHYAIADFVGVVVFRSCEEGACKAGSHFKSLRGRKTEHAFSQIGFQAVENRFAEANGHSAHCGINEATHAIALAADLFDAGDHFFGGIRIRAAHGIRFDRSGGHGVGIHAGFDIMDAGYPSEDFKAGIKGGENLFCDCGGSDATDRFARGGTSAALPVANAIFALVSEIGMRRAKVGFHFAVGLRPCIRIRNKNGDRRAECDSTENSRENLAGVFLLARRDDIALAWPATVEVRLNVRFGQG